MFVQMFIDNKGQFKISTSLKHLVFGYTIFDNNISIQGVKTLIHQSELRAYTKVFPFQEKSSFHFIAL